MYANYHTHTYLCNHATGTPEEYVKRGIENGLKILGFSDHSPYVFSENHYSSFRMSLDETKEYVDQINALKEQYNDKIKIYLGYEMEYYPRDFDKTIEFISRYGYDYLILGQHNINNEYDGAYSGSPCNEAEFKQYVKQVIEGMKTGKFLYVAHPDLINYNADEAIYKNEMTKLCEAAKELNIPLEFNLLGFEENRHYPCKPFWEIASRLGNTVILGSDAHRADRTGNREIYNDGLKALREFNIVPIEEMKIIPHQ